MTIYSQVWSLIKAGVSILGVKYLFKVQIIHFWCCAGNFWYSTFPRWTPKCLLLLLFLFIFFFKQSNWTWNRIRLVLLPAKFCLVLHFYHLGVQVQQLWDAGCVSPPHAVSLSASPGDVWCWLMVLGGCLLLPAMLVPPSCFVQRWHLGAPAKDKCSFVCRAETGQEITSTQDCDLNRQREQTPSPPSVKARRTGWWKIGTPNGKLKPTWDTCPK